ncbi:Guanylate-binding protein 6 [Myotis brandtii]|uniref:Guanylate-binding protein 6 n=1 Tax=Myotis brandtii TaxID=109478 RepID=S7MUQ2_MYOBR|nr:Guanylate-binding protein 6 [Myotis brandtii]
MASGYTMMDPICLVENQNNQLTVNPTALEILDKISQPVVVVAIAGLYRTGKSYLMNRLAGQNHGFCPGSTVWSETMGIWMWCVPHPLKPNHALVLLDIEGLGDVEKGYSKNDSWIFALAVLLSSMLVYNSMGTINHQALEQLHYVTELTKLIRTKSSPSSGEVGDSAMFLSFFPDFVWVVRNFTLDLKLDGCTISKDEYLENALKFQVSEDGLGTLAKTDVDTINSGVVPYLENAVITLAQRENSVAVEKAADHYSEQMAQRVSFPTHMLQELLDLHAACEKETIAIFMERSFKDDNQVFQTKLMVTSAFPSHSETCFAPIVAMRKLFDEMEKRNQQMMEEKEKSFKGIIKKKKENFLLKNEEESLKYCQAQLTQLSKPLMEGILRGTFSVPGGYILYSGEMNKVEQSYELVPRKGVKAMEVLQNFKQSQAATKESIIQADKALAAVEKTLKESIGEMIEEMQKKNEQMKGEIYKIYEVKIKQLIEKMEMEKAQFMAEQERILNLKL